MPPEIEHIRKIAQACTDFYNGLVLLLLFTVLASSLVTAAIAIAVYVFVLSLQ